MTRTYTIGDLVTVRPGTPAGHLSLAEAEHRRTIPGIITGVAKGPYGQLLTITWPDDRGGRGKYEPAELTPAPAATLDQQLAGEWRWYEQALNDTMHARLARPYATTSDLTDTAAIPRPRVWIAVDITADGARWYPGFDGDGGLWVELPAPGADLAALARDEALAAILLAADRGEPVTAARARVYARPEDADNGDRPHLTATHVA